MPTNTVRLHRVIRTSPERIYRVLLSADAMAKWLPPYSFTCQVHHMHAKVGGTFKMSFTNFSTGHGHAFGGEYRELVPNVQAGIPDVIPVEMCTLGWQESLEQRVKLVEPVISD